MAKIYKCPGCGGELVYESGTDHLVCPHCGRTVAVSALEEMMNAGQSVGLSSGAASDNAGNGVKEYHCPACGAAIVADENTVATFCSFCGNPTMIEEHASGVFNPSRLIPFQFDKKQAQEKFKAWAGKGMLTPASFQSKAVMDKVSGVYVPFWLYSYTTNVEIAGNAAIHHVERSETEEVITTEHFDIHRIVTGDYESVPYNASASMPDDDMQIIEPYDYSLLKNFAMPYLSGFFAEKFTYEADELKGKVQNALREDIVSAALGSIAGYDEVQPTFVNVDFLNEKTEYVMLPVWTLNYTYKGKKYPIYMNGATGKIDGVLPTSSGKVFALFIIIFIAVFVIAFILGRG